MHQGRQTEGGRKGEKRAWSQRARHQSVCDGGLIISSTNANDPYPYDTITPTQSKTQSRGSHPQEKIRKRHSKNPRKDNHLTPETIERAALSLESVDDVEGGDGLSLGVLSVGDGIADDTLEECLQNTTGLLVDHCDASEGVAGVRMAREAVGTYWPRYA